MIPYMLEELESLQVVPLPTGEKKFPPVGWTGSGATRHSLEEFYSENNYDDYSNLGLALVSPYVTGFDLDLHRNGATLRDIVSSGVLPWTVAVSRRWEPDVEGYTVFYATPDSSTLQDVAPVDIIRKGHRYSVIQGVVEDLEYYMYWTNGVEFYRITPETFAAAWTTLPEAPEALLERHTKAQPTNTHHGYPEGYTDYVEAPEGEGVSCVRVQAVARKGRNSIINARANDDSINRALTAAQWALVPYAHHSGYSLALESLRSAYVYACEHAGDHTPSNYEWCQGLSGAYAKREVTPPTREYYCGCSTEGDTETRTPREGNVSDYYPLILSELSRRGIQPQDREDVAQEVAMRVVASNPESLTAAYVRSRVAAVLVDIYRRNQTRIDALKDLQAMRAVTYQTRTDPHSVTINRLTLDALKKGLSEKEVATVNAHLSGVTLNSTERQVFARAKKKMRKNHSV